MPGSPPTSRPRLLPPSTTSAVGQEPPPAAATESASTTTAPMPSTPQLQTDPNPPAAIAPVTVAMAPFARLARVEVQLVMQHCDEITLLQLARCSRSTLAAASHSFAWRSLPPLSLQCFQSLVVPSRLATSLLRFARLSVSWGEWLSLDWMPPHRESETAEQKDTRMAAEAVTLAAIPGLRHISVRSHPLDFTRLCSALLDRLDHGGALASLFIRLINGDLRRDHFQPLAELVVRSRTLTALTVEGVADSDAIRCLADSVRQSQSLTTLSVRNQFGNTGVVALGPAVAHCRTLTDLQLPGCLIDHAGVESLVVAMEQGYNSIRSLNLRANPLGPAGAASVAPLLASDRCGLQSIDLTHCRILDAGAKPLSKALRISRTLTELRLGGCNIGTDGTAALTAALQRNSHIPLRQLDLTNNPVDAAGAASLAGLLRNNITLEELVLNSCNLDDAAVAALAACLPAAHSLRELHLGRGHFGAEGATDLAAGIGACPSLTLLDMSYNPSLRDGGLAVLAPALPHPHHFHVKHCGLSGESASALIELVQPGRNLLTLQLDGNAIGPAGVSAIAAALQSSTPLRTLHLPGCSVNSAAAAALSEALLRGWCVTDLRLERNPEIDDAGTCALAAALEQCGRHSSLQTLSLLYCGLTATGILALMRAAAAVPSLRSLSLCPNPDILSADPSALQAACGAEAHWCCACESAQRQRCFHPARRMGWPGGRSRLRSA